MKENYRHSYKLHKHTVCKSPTADVMNVRNFEDVCEISEQEVPVRNIAGSIIPRRFLELFNGIIPQHSLISLHIFMVVYCFS
jgi:hypothetical protein